MSIRRTIQSLSFTFIALFLFAQGLVAQEHLDKSQAQKLEAQLVKLAGEATPKTVMVQGVIGLGTGAVIDSAGTVVTNAHVAAGARYAILLHPDGRKELAKREGIDFERDLAVLRPIERPSNPVPYFELREQAPTVGTWVAALGYPGGPRGDAMPTFTVGRIVDGSGLSTVNGFLDYSGAIRTDTAIYSGNSGGPLVDLEGRLCGINGAVDFSGEEVSGLTIPTARVLRRIRDLDASVVRLPGGMTLDTRDYALLRLLEERLDKVIRDLMESQLEGGPGAQIPDGMKQLAEQAQKRTQTAPARGRRKAQAEAVERFLSKVTRQGRSRIFHGTIQKALASQHPLGLIITDEDGNSAFGTPVRGLGIVVCASSFRGVSLHLGQGNGANSALEVVGRAPQHDLLLLKPRRREGITWLTPATSQPPVGTLVGVLDSDGVQAGGVLSAHPRSIPSSPMALASWGQPSAPMRIINWFVEIAEQLDQDELAELGRQLRKAFELREGFSNGSAPRSYPRALSFDAPVGPAAAGAPLVDRNGTLIGVVVANAHFGTSYAVPASVLRRAFANDGAGAESATQNRRRRKQPQRSRPRRSAEREPDLF